jgi:hypothetical protein
MRTGARNICGARVASGSRTTTLNDRIPRWDLECRPSPLVRPRGQDIAWSGDTESSRNHASAVYTTITAWNRSRRDILRNEGAQDAPEPRPVQWPEAGPIVAVPEVGGLHHRYERRAA